MCHIIGELHFIRLERPVGARPDSPARRKPEAKERTTKFSELPMRPDPYSPETDDEEEEHQGPSKSQLKREQLELQKLGREMTKLGGEQLKKVGLPEEVYDEIVEYRRMKSFGAQRRQLQLIGKKMRGMDAKAVREAIDRATGESKAAAALLHRCEKLRGKMIEDDDAVKSFIDEHPGIDIRRLRELVRGARKEREAQKPPKNARALYRMLHELLDDTPVLTDEPPAEADEEDEP